MTVDIFMKVGDIKGESVDTKHRQEIEVRSWNWGVSNISTTHLGGGAGAGKVSVQDLTFSKSIDAASPKLFLACCEGKHFPQAQLTLRKAGQLPLEYFVITMKDVMVTSVSMSGTEADGTAETVTLNFGEVKVKYTPQDPTGKLGTAISAGWDIARNVKV